MFMEISSRRIPLEPGNLYMLGKEINDKHFFNLEEKDDIDKKHCVIEVSPSKDVYIFDLYSSHGTLLNNQLLKSLNKTLIKSSDIIKVGSQEIQFFHDYEQQEESHDSSGLSDINRISSSPESTSQRENRINRLNNNNFLIPPIPREKSATTPNKSVVTGDSDSKNANCSLNASALTNNSRSDSFTIPETQYCKSRTSLNGSDLSIAESIPETNASKIKFNFGNLDDEDDEFCIPETQELMPMSGNQRLKGLVDDRPRESTVVEENTADVEAEFSTKDIEGSQFRINTQEYNEGFGEETDTLHSQIIPIIKHNAVVLNASSVSSQKIFDRQNKEDKEVSSIKLSETTGELETTNLRTDCDTPDIFDFNDLEQNKEKATTAKDQNILEEDEDDLLPTQVFSLKNTKPREKHILNDIDKPCVEKENEEEIFTSSDKENKCPVALEPITDLPPIQLFAANEGHTAKSTLSNSSRSSNCNVLKTYSFAVPATVASSVNAPVENKGNSNLLPNLDPDDEDDLLTQAFLLPSNSSLAKSANKDAAVKCLNSTLLDEKSVDKNVAENTTLKKSTSLSEENGFLKVPEREFLAVRKTNSAISTTSETDLDLLMCTPQLIKEHLHVDMQHDLKKHILAAKNKNLFGDDTDEEDINDGPMDLVKLINVPKDFKDFDKLLPHLKSVKQHSEENEKQKAAKEAQKEYKFNVSFGKQQEFQQSSTSKSTKFNRDERHMARDRERELAERKEKQKSGIRQNESKDKRNKTLKDNTPETLEKNTRSRKRVMSTDKFDAAKEKEAKKPRETKENKSVEVKNKTEIENSEKTKENTKTKKRKEKDKTNLVNEKKEDNQIIKEINSKHTEKQMPTRRMTRSKSIQKDEASTSKEVLNKNKTKSSQSNLKSEDDLDSVSTEPFVRLTRCRLNSKNEESQGSTISNSSLSKSTNKSEKSSTGNIALNGNVKRTITERKRKAELPQTKVERKQLRSIHSEETSNSSSKVYISMTMVEPELFNELVKNSNGVWSIANNPAESEILVMDKAFRTFKFFLAMARGIPIVTSEYLRKINELQSIKKVCITDYLFSDAEFEKRHKFSLAKSLQIARKQKLFKDYEFLMTPNIVPNPSEIRAIIEASGGLVHVKSPSEQKKDQQIYLVSSAEDKKDWHKYRRLNKNLTIISTEAIMTSVMRQTCARMSSYILS